ncbi:probable serine/threonine-protein kinase clkA [Macrobrachium rosenbergii]|uniref:probable serine/threonine-protein kinase clkA n=1 Tax=Macrobrachium rosenbergii TaxID=79674 RepID=UPI0034D67A28
MDSYNNLSTSNNYPTDNYTSNNYPSGNHTSNSYPSDNHTSNNYPSDNHTSNSYLTNNPNSKPLPQNLHSSTHTILHNRCNNPNNKLHPHTSLNNIDSTTTTPPINERDPRLQEHRNQDTRDGSDSIHKSHSFLFLHHQHASQKNSPTYPPTQPYHCIFILPSYPQHFHQHPKVPLQKKCSFLHLQRSKAGNLADVMLSDNLSNSSCKNMGGGSTRYQERSDQHPNPQAEANRLVQHFADRTKTAHLPPSTRERQVTLNPG